MNLTSVCEKIKKAESGIKIYNEKISAKKKEIAALNKIKKELEYKERQSSNEKFISELEGRLGTKVTEDMIVSFINFQKQKIISADENSAEKNSAVEQSGINEEKLNTEENGY